MQSKNTFLLIGVFALGIIAGLGIGFAYGKSDYNAQLEQKNADLENRFRTVNDNYMVLVREYNKLFSLRGAPADTTQAVNSSATPKPTGAPSDAKATVVPTTAKPASTPTAVKPASSSTGASSTSSQTTGAKPKSEFKALAIDGTGPLEGAPPLLVRFTDLSTGNITSWKWEFGDGTTSAEKNPEHMFNTCPGDKQMCTIKLTVCGPGGCDTATKVDYLWVSIICSGC